MTTCTIKSSRQFLYASYK